MGRICLAAHSHRDGWPMTYPGQRRIRPTIERCPGTAPSHRRALRQRCASEGSSWQTTTVGSEGSAIAAASSTSSGIGASVQQSVRAGVELGDVGSVSANARGRSYRRPAGWRTRSAEAPATEEDGSDY
jgi:hypothetical protein